MQNYRKLQVWNDAYQLTLEIYRITKGFPSDERFGLVSQMRRCAASIAANIAEGCGRDSNPDLNRFLHIAMGSAAELETYAMLAHDLGYYDDSTAHILADRIDAVRRRLNRLIQRVKAPLR